MRVATCAAFGGEGGLDRIGCSGGDSDTGGGGGGGGGCGGLSGGLGGSWVG